MEKIVFLTNGAGIWTSKSNSEKKRREKKRNLGENTEVLVTLV